jgi:dephospho-CoA kinase
VDGLVAARPASVGLTGGIGSGKSTAAGFLQARGALLVDTDAIARALTQAGGAAMPALAAEFGPEAVSAEGALAREHMRRLAFADTGVKARLEAILHPLIGREALRQAAAGDGRTVVFDVPLLAESRHWRALVERVLVVDCDEATQVARVARRPGWNPEAARRVVLQQATRAARRAIADAVICNDGLTLEQFDAEVGSLWALWCGAST